MLFNSLHFLIFFPIVIILYFNTPHKYRWILLLISSYYFYMGWKPEYIILIIISTLIDYFASQGIYNTKSLFNKKIFLSISLIGNFALLFTFKYFNFFSESLREALKHISIEMSPITVQVLLPVGISFYTFQTVSYTIDVYYNKIKPEKHLGIFALYVSYFPQLVAGPIERAENLLPQFFEKHYFDYKNVTSGLKIMLWGFFKKVVIADKLSLIVNNVFNNVYDHSGTSFIIGTIFFAFQIYCDFSGYSDIAVGSARIMGFRLMDNFKRPYFSRSISEFWKRWHISLSTWFRDYLYIPLGGNRVSTSRWYLNLFIVFLLSGLWHGANWTFIVWGALHGIYLILEIITNPLKKRFFEITNLINYPKLIQIGEITFTFILVNIGWIFFRANNITEAIYILTHLFSNISFDIPNLNLGVGYLSLAYCFAIILFMESVHLIQEHKSIRQIIDNKPILLRWNIYLIMIIGIIVFGIFENTQFIYFQF